LVREFGATAEEKQKAKKLPVGDHQVGRLQIAVVDPLLMGGIQHLASCPISLLSRAKGKLADVCGRSRNWPDLILVLFVQVRILAG
jgi:hypothetical protein